MPSPVPDRMSARMSDPISVTTLLTPAPISSSSSSSSSPSPTLLSTVAAHAQVSPCALRHLTAPVTTSLHSALLTFATVYSQAHEDVAPLLAMSSFAYPVLAPNVMLTISYPPSPTLLSTLASLACVLLNPSSSSSSSSNTSSSSSSSHPNVPVLPLYLAVLPNDVHIFSTTNHTLRVFCTATEHWLQSIRHHLHPPTFLLHNLSHNPTSSSPHPHSRIPESIILPDGLFSSILSDLSALLSPTIQSWYITRSLPLTRTFLFHGPPSSGKLSTAFAIATSLSLHTFLLDASNPFPDTPPSSQPTASNVLIIVRNIPSHLLHSPHTLIRNARRLAPNAHATILILLVHHLDLIEKAVARNPSVLIHRRFHFPAPDDQQRQQLFISAFPNASSNLISLFYQHLSNLPNTSPITKPSMKHLEALFARYPARPDLVLEAFPAFLVNNFSDGLAACCPVPDFDDSDRSSHTLIHEDLPKPISIRAPHDLCTNDLDVNTSPPSQSHARSKQSNLHVPSVDAPLSRSAPSPRHRDRHLEHSLANLSVSVPALQRQHHVHQHEHLPLPRRRPWLDHAARASIAGKSRRFGAWKLV